jgi:hypothetical protein
MGVAFTDALGAILEAKKRLEMHIIRKPSQLHLVESEQNKM